MYLSVNLADFFLDGPYGWWNIDLMEDGLMEDRRSSSTRDYLKNAALNLVNLCRYKYCHLPHELARICAKSTVADLQPLLLL